MTILILVSRKQCIPSWNDDQYFVWYMNILYGIYIEPDKPVFIINHEPVRSPNINTYQTHHFKF